MSTKRNSKKDLPDDEALDEVNKHIKDAFDILKRETNKLRKERNAFDEVAKKLEHVHFSTMLKLNVGGHFFSTSLATMTKDPEQREILVDWLKDTRESLGDDYVLLYRASRNGWAASNFHSCCDNKGSTVTVIKSGNYIFGGYTEQPWQSSNTESYKRAPGSFLFSLVNASGLPPTKMPLIDGKEGNAIYCYSSCGPVFGGGHDLCVPNCPNSSNCSVNLGNTYQCPAGSMFHSMFSGRFDTKPGEDGSYFIDRDGTHFRYILNYLRTGKLVLPDDKVVRKELLNEAEFYQIDGILDELKANPFKDSAILSSEQREILVDWLKDTRESLGDDYVLLYRASRNGWAASTFHSCCDNKGPTVTVIKYGNYIFGGYTEQSWQSSNTAPYKRAPGSFLFSLVNASGLPPTKMPLIDGKEGSAIYCHNSRGPVFGGGHDLCVPDSPNSSNCSVNLGITYQCPAGQNGNLFLTGSQYFVVNEMEVFVFKN